MAPEVSIPVAPRLHDREFFYKYMPASTAKLVLESGRLRWSSPLLFNDPFDVPRTLAADAAASDISRAVADVLGEYFESPPEDLTDFDPKLRQVLEISRAGLPEELRAEIRSVIREAHDNPDAYSAPLDELREHWAQKIKEMRILCLTESPAHVAMWYHYADQYRGAVLGFRCTEAVDSGFRVAEPVKYLEQKPEVYSDRGIARLLCLNGMAAARETTRLGTLTKSADWSYEREWRLVSYKGPGESGLYNDWPFERVDLAFLYVGPLASDADTEGLIGLARKYPDVTIFRTTIGLDRELHFDVIGPQEKR